jgi:hypothetical protein
MSVSECLILVLRILMCVYDSMQESFYYGRNFRRKRWKPRATRAQRPDLVQLRSATRIVNNHTSAYYTRFASTPSCYTQVDDRSICDIHL